MFAHGNGNGKHMFLDLLKKKNGTRLSQDGFESHQQNALVLWFGTRRLPKGSFFEMHFVEKTQLFLSYSHKVLSHLTAKRKSFQNTGKHLAGIIPIVQKVLISHVQFPFQRDVQCPMNDPWPWLFWGPRGPSQSNLIEVVELLDPGKLKLGKSGLHD